MNLKGKNALITGGGRGLGKAVAVALANEGVNVGITGRNEEHLKSTVAELEKLGVKAVYSVFNVDEMAQVEQGVASIASQLGSIDILINNAGIAIDNELKDKTAEEFNKVLSVNLTGTFLVTKYAICKMDRGSIINISSTNAIDTYYMESVDYDASKAGIISLTHNFAHYLDEIRVNCICPDWIDTEMNKDMDYEYKSKIKFLKPEEVASLVYKVATNEKINDQIIRISGEKND